MTRKQRIKNAAEKILFGTLALIGLWGTIHAFTKRSYTEPAPVKHREPKYISLKEDEK